MYQQDNVPRPLVTTRLLVSAVIKLCVLIREFFVIMVTLGTSMLENHEKEVTIVVLSHNHHIKNANSKKLKGWYRTLNTTNNSKKQNIIVYNLFPNLDICHIFLDPCSNVLNT